MEMDTGATKSKTVMSVHTWRSLGKPKLMYTYSFSENLVATVVRH